MLGELTVFMDIIYLQIYMDFIWNSNLHFAKADIMKISKADWKLFREKIGEWQETYMERLNRELIEILSSDKAA